MKNYSLKVLNKLCLTSKQDAESSGSNAAAEEETGEPEEDDGEPNRDVQTPDDEEQEVEPEQFQPGDTHVFVAGYLD